MPIYINCHFCGKIFSKTPKDFKKTKHFHFCSKACHDDWQRKSSAKTCLFCAKKFNGGNEMYCSIECMRKAGRGGKVIIQCEVCGSPFVTWKNEKNRRKTCSKKCAITLKSRPVKERVKIICGVCGKEIFLTENRAKNRQFCSKECKDIFRYRKPVVCINCNNCGKEIRIYPSRQGTTVFCNRKCQREYEASKLITKICPECNKPFETIPARQYFKYCSKECYLAVLSRGGEDHPNWKGGCAHYYGPNWQKQSKKARQRDNCTCQVCGLHQIDNYRVLDVHHIKRFQEFGLKRYKEANRLINLITLCPTCHRKVEAGKIAINKVPSG